MAGRVLPLTFVEIRTAVSPQYVSAAVSRSNFDMIIYHIDSEYTARIIPKNHLGQMLHQMIVTELNFSVYMYFGESGKDLCSAIYCPSYILSDMTTGLESLGTVCACGRTLETTFLHFLTPKIAQF